MYKFSMVTICVAMLAVACNSGGVRKAVGAQCPAGNYKPFPMELTQGQREISLDADKQQIPPGVYSYEGATLYYVDNSDLRIQVQDVKQADSVSFKANVACLRNAVQEFHPVAVDGIRSLDVTKAHKVIGGEVNDFVIGTEKTVFTVKATKNGTTKVESPSLIYQSNKAARYFMLSFPNDEVNYEIRSSGNTPDGQYFLQIKLKKGPPRE